MSLQYRCIMINRNKRLLFLLIKLENSCPSPSSSPTPHHISSDSLDFQFTGIGQESDQARLDPQVRNLFDSLQIALRTQPNSFVMR